jgi:hypothetical protein
LGVLASPIALPLGIALIAVIFSLLVSAISVIFSFFVAAIAMIIAGVVAFGFGFFTLFVNFPTGIMMIGTGLVSTGLGAALLLAMIWLSKVTINGIAALGARFLQRRRSTADGYGQGVNHVRTNTDAHANNLAYAVANRNANDVVNNEQNTQNSGGAV